MAKAARFTITRIDKKRGRVKAETLGKKNERMERGRVIIESAKEPEGVKLRVLSNVCNPLD